MFEVYKLVCMPAGSANTPERLICPRCGVEIYIDWRALSGTEATILEPVPVCPGGIE